MKIAAPRTRHVALIAASLLFAAWSVFTPDGASPVVIWPCLLSFYWLFYRAFRTSVLIPGGKSSSVKGDTLFLIFAYLLFYLPYQLSVVGDLDLMYSRFVAATFVEKSNASLLLTTSGLLAFVAGIDYGKLPKTSASGADRNNVDYVDGFTWSALAVSGMLVSVYLVTGAFGAMFANAYSGSTTSNRTDDGVYYLITYFSTVLFACALYRRWKHGRFGSVGMAALAWVSFWSLCLLLLGDRNSLLLVALTGLCAASHLIVKVGRVAVVGGLLLALIGYNIVEASRQSEVRDLSAVAAAIGSYQQSSFADSSFTNTTVTSRAAMAYVPAQLDYFYGKFKLIGFSGVIPYSRGIFVEKDDPYVTSSDVVTEAVLGSHSTWSLGTNVISDLYLDFGFFGVPLLMAAAGVVLGALTARAAVTVPTFDSLLAYFIAVPLFAELPRYSFDFPVRPIAWTLALLFVYRQLWATFGRPTRH